MGLVCLSQSSCPSKGTEVGTEQFRPLVRVKLQLKLSGVLKFSVLAPVVDVNLWVFGGGVNVLPPPAVNEGGGSE